MEPNTTTPRMEEQERQPIAASPATQSAAPIVSGEERRHLAECCAFFKAEQYREAQPDTIREDDVRKAEEEIDRVIENSAIGRRAPEGA